MNFLKIISQKMNVKKFKKVLDFSVESDIITLLLVRAEKRKLMRNGVIGSTADSDSVSRGSSPFSVAWNLLNGRFLLLSECGSAW